MSWQKLTYLIRIGKKTEIIDAINNGNINESTYMILYGNIPTDKEWDPVFRALEKKLPNIEKIGYDAHEHRYKYML